MRVHNIRINLSYDISDLPDQTKVELVLRFLYINIHPFSIQGA